MCLQFYSILGNSCTWGFGPSVVPSNQRITWKRQTRHGGHLQAKATGQAPKSSKERHCLAFQLLRPHGLGASVPGAVLEGYGECTKLVEEAAELLLEEVTLGQARKTLSGIGINWIISYMFILLKCIPHTPLSTAGMEDELWCACVPRRTHPLHSR